MYEFNSEKKMDVEERQRLIDDITKCGSLHWNFKDLHSLPEELEEFGQKLKYIYLNYNMLANMPTWMTEMDNLTEINVGFNQLESIPKSIGNLVNLATLSAPGNKLKSIPSSLHDLKHLQVLNLSHNEISFISKDIGKNVELEILTLGNNRLTSLPEEISKCTELWDLTLDNNLITHLPLCVASMPKLKYISVQNNKLKCLPAIPFLDNHEKILYGGNQKTLKNIPFLEQYMDGVYYRSTNPGDQRENEGVAVSHRFNPTEYNNQYPKFKVQFKEDGSHVPGFPKVCTLYDLALNAMEFNFDKIRQAHTDPVEYEKQRKIIPKSVLEDIMRPRGLCYCCCQKVLYNRALVCYFPHNYVIEGDRPYHMTQDQKFVVYFHPNPNHTHH